MCMEVVLGRSPLGGYGGPYGVNGWEREMLWEGLCRACGVKDNIVWPDQELGYHCEVKDTVLVLCMAWKS
jgi:hypothetical protein